jgi:hypothetical protein
MAPTHHLSPLLRLWNVAAVCRVVLERLDLGFGFTDAAMMELAKKVEREIWKMN